MVHRNFVYDNEGHMQPTIIVDNRIDIIRRIRKQLSMMESELMEANPQEHVVVHHLNKITHLIAEGFQT